MSVSDGTFIMNGGYITSNTATSGTYGYGGGGVWSNGTFIMNGGYITSNTAAGQYGNGGNGGGVCIRGDTFTYNSGTISGNSGTGKQVYAFPYATINGSGGKSAYLWSGYGWDTW